MARGRRGRRHRRLGRRRGARVHRPARPPARARQRGRRDGRVRAGGGRARRLHDGLRDAEHDARPRRAGGPRADPGRRGRVRVAGGAAGPRRRDGRVGRARRWPRSASWPMPGSSASPTTGRRCASASILRNALAYAGALGLPIVDHAGGRDADRGRRGERRVRRHGARAARLAGRGRGDGRGAGPRDPRRRRPRRAGRAAAPDPRLDGRRAGARPRARRRAGLPVTCDVTPHHLALTDEWIAGARRWAWDGRARDPWARRGARGRARTTRRCGSTRRSARPRTRRPAWPRCADGTADAIATDHAPHTEVDKAVEFGLGGQRDQRHRDGARARPGGRRCGRLPLARAIEALTTRSGAGPRRSIAAERVGRARRGRAGRPRGLRSLRALDRDGRRARVARQEHAAARHGAVRPVLLTMAGGRVAYEAPDA